MTVTKDESAERTKMEGVGWKAVFTGSAGLALYWVK